MNSRILMKEIQVLVTKPLEGIRVDLPDDLTALRVTMAGPDSTPFAGGHFTYELYGLENYPTQAPRGRFITPIFHPNIAPPGASSNAGDICVNTIKRDWDASKPDTYNLRHVLEIIRCLLIEPNPDSALNEEAAKLIISGSYAEYELRAKKYTQVHAVTAAAGAAAFSGLGDLSRDNANSAMNNSAAAGGGGGASGNNMEGGSSSSDLAPQKDAAAGKSKADAKRRQMLKRL